MLFKRLVIAGVLLTSCSGPNSRDAHFPHRPDDGTPDPDAVALAVIGVLDSLVWSHPSAIGGSIASSFAGEPQSTIDTDIVAALEDRHVTAFEMQT